jgi:hypothetical protein
LVTGTNEAEVEIKVRIAAGNKCCHAADHLMKKKYITRMLRARVCKN